MVLGFVERQFYGRMENFLLLLYKRFIYVNRLSNKSVKFEGFKVYIKGIMTIEEKMASKNNKLPQHFQTWDLLRGRFQYGIDGTSPLIISFFVKGGGMGNWGWGKGTLVIYIHMYNVIYYLYYIYYIYIYNIYNIKYIYIYTMLYVYIYITRVPFPKPQFPIYM